MAPWLIARHWWRNLLSFRNTNHCNG